MRLSIIKRSLLLQTILQSEVHHRQVDVLFEPVLGGSEYLQALHSVVAQVLAQSLRTSHAFQVEVFLLEDEEGRVDAGIVGGYLSGIGGHFDSIVIGHECPDGSLILFSINF